MNIKGRTVIVTGSGSGIGRVLAVEFAANGANVVCCGRREALLHESGRLGHGASSPGNEAVLMKLLR